MKKQICLGLGLLLVSGCHWGLLMKRQSECNCPTDIRQTIPWSLGEDAIFQCPCRPDCDYYGYKPTCWSEWPGPAAAWRDTYCAPGMEACPPDWVGPVPTDPGWQPMPAAPDQPTSGRPMEEIPPPELESAFGPVLELPMPAEPPVQPASGVDKASWRWYSPPEGQETEAPLQRASVTELAQPRMVLHVTPTAPSAPLPPEPKRPKRAKSRVETAPGHDPVPESPSMMSLTIGAR